MALAPERLGPRRTGLPWQRVSSQQLVPEQEVEAWQVFLHLVLQVDPVVHMPKRDRQRAEEQQHQREACQAHCKGYPSH